MACPRSTVCAVLLFGVLASGCQASVAEGPATPALTTTRITSLPSSTTIDTRTGVVVRVASVTDGDTIRVLMPDGINEPVRLIGIDAPEDGLALDQEATSYLQDLVLGQDVEMVADVSDRDRFGRLLRYVYVGDLFVNEEMVRMGLAVAKRYEPDTAMALVLEAAQGGAQDQALGLFSSSASTTIATTTAGGCDPSYPDFCLPPSPPTLNCGDIGAQNFTVLAPDPHGFDGNGDGVGCEA
jgi:micrococcal nuclease